MKIVIIGGTGTIGRAVARQLGERHEVVVAGHRSGEVRVDLVDASSIEKLFTAVGSVDAIVCTTGEARWGPFDQLSEEDYYVGIRSKLMGQVNVVRIGRRYLNRGGSFTLTTGVLGDDPVRLSAGAALVNGAINSFVKAVAIELTDDRRINAVSPGLTEETAVKSASAFPGHIPVPMKKVVAAYVRSVEGGGSGAVLTVYDA